MILKILCIFLLCDTVHLYYKLSFVLNYILYCTSSGYPLLLLFFGMFRADHVIGNRGRSHGFRLDQNRTLHPDQGSDIYIYIFMYIYSQFLSDL